MEHRIKDLFWPDQTIKNILYYDSLENHLLEHVIYTGMEPPMMYFFSRVVF